MSLIQNFLQELISFLKFYILIILEAFKSYFWNSNEIYTTNNLNTSVISVERTYHHKVESYTDKKRNLLTYRIANISPIKKAKESNFLYTSKTRLEPQDNFFGNESLDTTLRDFLRQKNFDLNWVKCPVCKNEIRVYDGDIFIVCWNQYGCKGNTKFCLKCNQIFKNEYQIMDHFKNGTFLPKCQMCYY